MSTKGLNLQFTFLWGTPDNQGMELDHLVEGDKEKQLLISITFQMQTIVLPISLHTELSFSIFRLPLSKTGYRQTLSAN
jgi:hypothetical protein